jgi:hypothetical protein
LSDEPNAVFGIDSKAYIKQWIGRLDGKPKEFRSNIGVVVNPESPSHFGDEYNKILDELFLQYGIKRTQKIYKSADIGKCFPGQESKANTFRLAFTRRILNLDDLYVNYCFTRINSKHLTDEKVTIFGRYGYATQKINAKDFIFKLDGYYNVLCSWKVMKDNAVEGSLFLCDGMDPFYPTIAWEELTSKNDVKIVYAGDRTNPLMATADILTKTLEIFLQIEYAPLTQDTIKKIVTYEDKVNDKNISYTYIGNPDLHMIKPQEDRRYSLEELQDFIKRPIIFIGKGSIPGQRDTLENLPIYSKIHDKAYDLGACVRVYDPKIDSRIIGRHTMQDYFISLTPESDEQFTLLERGGANVKRLDAKDIIGSK